MKREISLGFWVFSVILVAVLTGCSGSDDADLVFPVSQAFGGTFVTTAGNTGTVQFTRVSPVTSAAGGFMAAMIDVTGTVTPSGGAPVDFSGTIDDAAAFFSASGGGYNFNGFFDAGLIGGGISGPAGSGVFAVLGSDTGTAQTFCGDWIESGASAPGGLFSLTIQGNRAVANVVDFLDNEAFLLSNNLVSGNSVTLAAYPEEGNDLTATGTFSGTTVSGNWTSSAGSAGGTFQGSAQGCVN